MYNVPGLLLLLLQNFVVATTTMTRYGSLSLSLAISVTRKKLPNVYKSCPKMISLEKLNILTTLQKMS